MQDKTVHTAKITAISTPVGLDFNEPKQLLAYCARVSATANQHKHDTGPRLLAYLCRNAEWSPFEMGSMTLEISTTRDIGRQILRHRSFSFQEFSQRYAAVTAPPVFREARLQDNFDRQNSIELDINDPANMDLAERWLGMQRYIADVTRRIYEDALEMGIAKEVARAVLPEGMTPSTMYMAGTIRSWIHYIALRQDRKTQKEHRSIALAARRILLEHYPDVMEALPLLEFDEEAGQVVVPSDGPDQSYGSKCIA
jgi:thymidylate synthase (FAD)